MGVMAFVSNIILMDETLPRLQGPGNLWAKYTRLAMQERVIASSDTEGMNGHLRAWRCIKQACGWAHLGCCCSGLII